jgi:hypothetical protein
MTSRPASSPRLMVARRAAGWVSGIHTSGSNWPRLMASRGAGRVRRPPASQPRPASACRCRINENSASSGLSSQATSIPAAVAVRRSREATSTARSSGRSGATTNRNRGRARPAVCLVRVIPSSTRDRTARDSSSSTRPASVSRSPPRWRCSSGVPMIFSSRRICWLSVGCAMNICSAACVNVPASATATKYRKCRSSTPCGSTRPEPGHPSGPSPAVIVFTRPRSHRSMRVDPGRRRDAGRGRGTGQARRHGALRPSAGALRGLPGGLRSRPAGGAPGSGRGDRSGRRR